MVIPLKNYDEILNHPDFINSPGDEGFELTAEDEKILDRVWADLREERQKIEIPKTMSNEETLSFFGLSQKLEKTNRQ